MRASDAFSRAVIELLTFIEQGSTELQERNKAASTDLSLPLQLPQKLLIYDNMEIVMGVEDGDDRNEVENNKNCKEKHAAILTAWPGVEDPFLASLIGAFQNKCGCDISSLHVYIAILRVLQLSDLLQVYRGEELNRSGMNTRINRYDSDVDSRIVRSLPTLKQLFGQEIIAIICTTFPPGQLPDISMLVGAILKADTKGRSPLETNRYDYIHQSFKKLVLVGGLEQANRQMAASWSSDSQYPRATVGSDAYNGSTIAATAAVVCYQLGDLWGLSVQRLRVMHMAVLLDVNDESGSHSHAVNTVDMCVWKDFEVENLIPLVGSKGLSARRQSMQ